MLKLFNRIKKIAKLDSAGNDSFVWLAYFTEEAGEVTRCILEEKGHKNAKASETSLQECSDALNSLIGLYINLGGNYDDLINYSTKKLDRWEKRLNAKKSQ